MRTRNPAPGEVGSRKTLTFLIKTMTWADIPEDLWPVHLKPEPGELLSSWMVRFAHAHGLRVETMCSQLFGRASSVWNRDIDRSISAAMLRKLSSASGHDLDLLQQGTLQSFEGIISERINSRGSSSGVLPLGVYHRKRTRRSLMYCPQCLRTDTNPFFRKAWRISWITTCSTHGLRLFDCCPQCNESIVPHRVDMKWRMQTSVGSTLHTCCHQCSFDLRWAPESAATVDELAAGCWMDHALQFGWVAVGDSVVYAPAFFAGISALVLALHSKVRWQGLDMSSLEQRRELISRACLLLPEWPTRFLKRCSESNWTSVDLTLPRKQLPFWLHQVVRQNIDQKRATISAEEAQAIYEKTIVETGKFSVKAARFISGRRIEQRHLRLSCRAEVSDDSFELLLAHIDHLISRQPKLEERCHLFADKVIFALARVCGFTQVDIAKYLMGEAMAFASQDRPDFWKIPTTRQDVAAWVGWYLRDIRPNFKLPTNFSHVFVCRQNYRPLSASTLGERFRTYVGDADLQRDIGNYGLLRLRSQGGPTIQRVL